MRTELIVALDTPTLSEARAMVRRLRGAARIFKVGSELFTAAGPAAVKMVLQSGGRVFLDLKYHDIPNTVGRAVAAATRLGVSMLTVHTSGGEDMLAAAVDASRAEAKAMRRRPPLILGVTVLTSLDRAALAVVGVERAVEEQVEHLAQLAVRAGAGGVVASPLEISRLRGVLGPSIKLVAAGIRTHALAGDDQARAATPAAAALAGADYIVVGRPVTGAGDPRAAALAIRRELSCARLLDVRKG